MNAKTICEFTVGSHAFFNKLPDYKGNHDIDILYIIDYPIFGDHITIIHKKDIDTIFLYNSGKENIINNVINYYEACTFLVPEFAEYINLEINDLKKLEHWFNKTDDKHKYVKIIYDSYIKNNGFYLTDEQLSEAYELYKKYRNY